MNMLEILKELIEVPGISGYEEDVRVWIIKKLQEIDPKVKTSVDNIGNLIVPVCEGPKTIVVMAHMDELGMVVTKVEKNGSLRVRTVGGIDQRTLIGRIVEIKTKKGIVPGVIGLKPLHLMKDRSEIKKSIPVEDMYVDIGSTSKKETQKMGVELLDPMVLKKEFLVMNKKYISARGLDDRCGCAILIDMFKRLKRVKIKQGLTLVFSVQEEIGLRGATVIANTLKPEFIFAVDSFSGTDQPGLKSNIEPAKLGAGPTLRLIDNRAMASPMLKEYLVKLAKKKKIPLQMSVTGGSTDGAAVQECGAAMMPIAIPLRYTHSPVEVVHYDDMVNASKLLVEAVKGL